MSNTPQIRFAGFTDAWEQRELRTAATFSKGSGYSKNDLKENGTPIILYGRLYTKYETVINEVDTFVDVQSNSVYSTGHEVIVPASGETAEDISRASFVAKSGILLGGDLNIIVPDDYINPVFLALTISNGNQQKELSKRAQGKSVVHIHNSDLENVVLLYPKYEEQEKIGEYFSKLDNLITLHQRKCDALQKFKKSMLQKMFPQNGESVPEIRFAGFTDAWEQRKVGELTVESSEYTTLEAGFPLLTSSRNGLMYQNEYRGKQTTDSTETMFSIVPLGACTYRHMSDDDVFHLNVNRLEKGLVSREYPVFYASDDNNLDFIVQQINSSAEFRSFCAEQKKGGTRTRLYYKNLCEFQMLIPNTEEQEKIATFLLTLDTLITLHQRKLETLQKMKKSLLQKMFV